MAFNISIKKMSILRHFLNKSLNHPRWRSKCESLCDQLVEDKIARERDYERIRKKINYLFITIRDDKREFIYNSRAN